MMKLLPILAILALPLVAALPAPALCGPECRITAASAGYDPAVTTIATGSSVVWSSADITHVQRDQAVGSARPCFEVLAEPGGDTPAVRFDLAAGALVATVDGVSATCTSAVATPAGAVVAYFCSLHPTMRAAIVVTG